jgi:hypothetical protein
MKIEANVHTGSEGGEVARAEPKKRVKMFARQIICAPKYFRAKMFARQNLRERVNLKEKLVIIGKLIT